MGVQEMALMLLGIGILSEKFGGGKGLISLGTGVQALVAAPLTGTGTGLSSLAVGLRSLAESFGDIGRGLSSLFEAIPRGPLTGIPFAPVVTVPSLPAPSPLPPIISMLGPPPLIPDSGGSGATLLPGGGGHVPIPQPILYAPIAPPTPRPRPPQDPDNAGGSPSLRFYHVL